MGDLFSLHFGVKEAIKSTTSSTPARVRTVRERAEAIGGQVTITYTPGQSTTVEVAVALRADEGV